MRIAIIGAGAMGSIFGSMLSLVARVYLIDTFEDHVSKINASGLTIEYMDGSKQNRRVFAATDASMIGALVDVMLIFTKSYTTRQAALSAKPFLSENGHVLTLQNGLGNVDMIADIFGIEKTIAGVTSHGGTFVEPGVVRHAGTGPTYMAGHKQHAQAVFLLAKLFNKAGIETVVSDNIDSLIWGKLIINVGINAMTAILRVKNGVLAQTPACEVIMAKAVSEAVAVAEALEIKLPFDDPFKEVKKVCVHTAENRASMLQDVLKGSRTEIGVINRAIVEKGKQTGMLTPYNLFLSEVIEAIEATSDKRCV
jgi:2-dehydropantoate 2-reductase